MKRDAARTKTSPHLGADTRLPFSFERRIPSGQPAVGFRSGLTGNLSLGVLSSRLMKRNLASAKGGGTRLSLASGRETNFKTILRSRLWHQTVGGGYGALSPTVYAIV